MRTEPVRGVSVIIKALNEEAKIAAAIESALRAIAGVGGEVILADAISEDRTVQIARRYPITIVQLARIADRGCGSGPQLGFQHARGEFIYLMDGDMELRPGFIEAALPHLRAEADLAGVGGMMDYAGAPGIEYRARLSRRKRDERPGYVNHLSCGGLYRAAAIRQVGYFSNRNLHSFEELDLGLRLGSAGWKLKRIEQSNVLHHVHGLGACALLAKRWRDGFGLGAGELLRSALGKSYLRHLLSEFRHLWAVGGWMALLPAVLAAPVALPLRLPMFIGLFAAPFALVAIRRRSLEIGVYSISSSCIALVAATRGALRTPVDPSTPLDSRVLQQGEWIPG